MEMRNNHADNIENFMQEDGHRVWGLVVYRCTYGSDADWAEFMTRLRTTIDGTLEFDNGLDLLDSLRLTVFEDRDTLDGASTMVVRGKFREWAETAAQQEQGTGAALSQRYRFCVMVDGAALESVLRNDLYSENAFFKLVYGAWDPSQQDEVDGYEDEDDEELEEDGLEPLEGCILDDIGWMRVSFDNMVRIYCFMRGSDAWIINYFRPPQIMNSQAVTIHKSYFRSSCLDISVYCDLCYLLLP